MAKSSTNRKSRGRAASPKTVETLTHDEATRKNTPTAEFQSVMAKEHESPIRVAYEHRHLDLGREIVEDHRRGPVSPSSDNADGIACWFIDRDYNEESFFVRHAYFLGASDPYKSLKTTLKAEIDPDAWATLHSDTSRPFPKPKNARIAVKVINHLGDEVMKVFRV